MEQLEPVLVETAPHAALVAGDVNSTLGAALTAVKLEIPVGHIEAGLRSFDRSMPEEINLGIPCFTLRANTERAVACSVGTNTLFGLAPERIADVPRLLAEKRPDRTRIPELRDGAAAQRIVDVLVRRLD